MGQVSTVGLDLAKSIFQAHGADASGEVVFRKKLGRGRLLAFFAGLAPCVVALGCHGCEPLGIQAVVELDAIDSFLRRFPDCRHCICKVRTASAHNFMARRRPIQKRAQTQDAGPSVLLPFTSSVKNPIQLVTGIPDGCDSESEELWALPSHEMHMGINQARQNSAIGLMVLRCPLWHGITRHNT